MTRRLRGVESGGKAGVPGDGRKAAASRSGRSREAPHLRAPSAHSCVRPRPHASVAGRCHAIPAQTPGHNSEPAGRPSNLPGRRRTAAVERAVPATLTPARRASGTCTCRLAGGWRRLEGVAIAASTRWCSSCGPSDARARACAAMAIGRRPQTDHRRTAQPRVRGVGADRRLHGARALTREPGCRHAQVTARATSPVQGCLVTKSRHMRRLRESPLPDSNRRPLPYHGSALPAELRGRGDAE